VQMKQNVDTLIRRAEAAEKTADILKAKVISLYNSGPDTAIHRQLERAKHREEAARHRQEVMRARAQELERHNADLEEKVADRTRTIREILDHVVTGFMLVDREGVIQPGYTESCYGLFSTSEKLAGKTLWTVLGLDADEAFAYELGFEQLIADFFPEETALGQLRDKFTIDDHVVQIVGRVIRDEEGEIAKLLFTISDITEQVEAERERETNRILLEILRQREPFNAFIQDTKIKLELARKAIELDDERYARRAIHTIKGNAGSYGLDHVMKTCHEVEKSEVLCDTHLHQIESSMRGFLHAHHEVLEIRYEDNQTHTYDIEARALEELERFARQSSDHELAEKIHVWLAKARLCPASSLLGPLENFMQQIAQRLEKDIAFEVRGEDVLVDAEQFRPVVMNLTHLLRNAADHGIEHANDRVGKDPRGRIQLAFEDRGREHRISVTDDGCGIDTERLAACALANGIIDVSEIQQRTSEQLLELIYLDGLSTKFDATEISGRGVGMSAVRAVAEGCGGHVEIATHRGQGTSITLVLPKQEAHATS